MAFGITFFVCFLSLFHTDLLCGSMVRCVLYGMGWCGGVCGAWVQATEEFESQSFAFRYFRCFHWGIWALTSMGRDLTPDTALEIVLGTARCCALRLRRCAVLWCVVK
jgi:hypothetical protein